MQFRKVQSFTLQIFPCLAGFQPPIEVPDNPLQEKDRKLKLRGLLPRLPVVNRMGRSSKTRNARECTPRLQAHTLSSQKRSFISDRPAPLGLAEVHQVRATPPPALLQTPLPTSCHLGSALSATPPKGRGMRKVLKRKGGGQPTGLKGSPRCGATARSLQVRMRKYLSLPRPDRLAQARVLGITQGGAPGTPPHTWTGGHQAPANESRPQ